MTNAELDQEKDRQDSEAWKEQNVPVPAETQSVIDHIWKAERYLALSTNHLLEVTEKLDSPDQQKVLEIMNQIENLEVDVRELRKKIGGDSE